MKYYEDDQFHGDEEVIACSASEGAEKCVKSLAGTPERTRSLLSL